MSRNIVFALWTGRYPNLCRGEWTLIINHADYSDKIPEDKRCAPMGTYGIYQVNTWGIDDEVHYSYTDGLHYRQWIRQNKWVLKLPAKPHDVYAAFQAADWRPQSCGGCI